MTPFLKHTATDLYTRYGENISDLCIVFPNRRASLYFKKYLSEITDKPIWSPVSTTINDLMQEISELKVADNIKLLFELYKVYTKVKKSNETFDEFYFWGEMLLNDFDNIDKYMVNPEDLFKNLKNLKSIQDQFTYLTENQIEAIKEFWNSFDPEKYSVHQQDFISIWNVLFDMYTEFKTNLKASNIAYEGMVYKAVADKLKDNSNVELKHSKYVFIGFNALNNCEKVLFTHLNNNKKADFYWDYDELYIKNEKYEAGYFLRENLINYKQNIGFETKVDFTNLSSPKTIEVISVPSDVGQAKLITRKLLENTNQLADSPDKTAIVLADEHLLIPVIHSVPDSIDKVNITMGYPVINTPIYSLLEHIIELQKNSKQSTSGTTTFYHKNVLAILNHQYIRTQFPVIANELIQYIQTKNRIQLSSEELGGTSFLGNVFRKINNYIELSDYLLSIIHQIYNSLYSRVSEDNIHSQSIEKEYIYHIFLSINRVKDVLTEQKVEIKIDTFIRLLRKIIRNLRIPFTGEPLTGLQVMGILETRLLDFENLYILSMNEGILPKSEASLSFIPYNLRRGFGLPTVEHQDAIYAYYFYRLIQRAKNIILIYNSKTEGLQSGEMSRFIYQLKFENNFTIHERSIRYDINTTIQKEISIFKNEDVFKKLKKYYSSEIDNPKYFSPSALTTYLTCKLRFYFRYIAELQEKEELTEEVDAPLFGNILHETMHVLYKPYIDKIVDSKIIQSILQDSTLIANAIDTAFNQQYFKTTDKTVYSGKNIIIREMIEKYVKQILKTDENYSPFKILSLENKYQVNVQVNISGKTENINLGGKIDRIDKIENQIRIIDYKSGNDKLEFKSISALFSDIKENRNSAVFQTLLYSKFYIENNKTKLPIAPGIYSLRKLFENNFDPRVLNKDNKTILTNYNEVNTEFSDALNNLITEIFNPSMHFIQTEDAIICKNCPYNQICNR